MFDFHGRRVIVAGGSKGIGRAIALGFARAGAGVSVCARGQASLDALAKEVASEGLALHVAPCDIGDKAELETYLQNAMGELGGLDVLVNCASAFGREDNEEGWLSSVEVDLMGTVRAGHICLPALKETGGTIINIASIAALHASTRTAPYAAIKAAVAHYTGSLAVTMAPHKVRVNGIAPGSIEFPGGVVVSGPAEQSRALPAYSRGDSLRAPGHAGGSRRRRVIPGLRSGPLDYRPDTGCGRRPGFVLSRQLIAQGVL